jgi:hypothetical protein
MKQNLKSEESLRALLLQILAAKTKTAIYQGKATYYFVLK